MHLILPVAAALFGTTLAQSISAAETVSIFDDLSRQSRDLQSMARLVTDGGLRPVLVNIFRGIRAKCY